LVVTRPLKALTKETATGNGVASTADMIRLSSSVLGSVNLLRRDMNRRFGETAQSLDLVDGKLGVVCEKVGCLEEARRTDAALAAQAKGTATERNADRVQHALSRNQRLAIGVAAFTGCGGLALGVVTLLLRVTGVLT
jgi:tetrahydromethanopterin S-methyltransferase subunit F